MLGNYFRVLKTGIFIIFLKSVPECEKIDRTGVFVFIKLGHIRCRGDRVREGRL